MKTLKKLLLDLLVLVLIISLVSCGTYKPPVNNDDTDEGGGENESGNNTEQPPTVEDGTEYFTVTIMVDGLVFTDLDGIEAQWSDGKSVYRAPFVDGTAKVAGLDGDYTVTLTDTPDGYAYDANAHVATNLKKDITIELHTINVVTGSGTGPFQAIKLTKSGVYQVALQSEDHMQFFSFEAKRSGRFKIESWVDTGENLIDPDINMYIYSTGALSETITDGGTASDYTSNFQFTAYIDETNIQYNNGVAVGGVSYIFAVYAKSQTGEYPLTFNFAVLYEGTYESPKSTSVMVIPESLPKTSAEIDEWYAKHNSYSGTPTNAWNARTKILDGSKYKYNPEDGYYHVYNELLYASNNGFGPILYAHITSECLGSISPFNTIEYAGNKALSIPKYVDDKLYFDNYKLFIEGWDELIIAHGDAGPYYCMSSCPCYIDNKHNSSAEGACFENCRACLDDCRHPSQAEAGQKGYADFANKDGLCPVTEELKEFLQKFAMSQRYFYDGNGFAESGFGLKSTVDDVWLYACCYYNR